jgi:hypothetical protein
VLALAASGCALLPGRFGLPRLAECPGALVATEALPAGDFLLRERVRIVGGGVDIGLELVAEKRADRLVVVAMNAFGTKLFSLVQRGLAVESDSRLGRALPVPPENVLFDLHAARFARSDAPARVTVARPGCDYTATFVSVERRELAASPSP